MADDPRIRPAAEAMEDAAMRYLGHDLGTFYRDDIAAAGIVAADAADPLRALLADEAEAARKIHRRAAAEGHFVSEVAVQYVLAALREVAGL